jgi:putative protein-disulfide isomerase
LRHIDTVHTLYYTDPACPWSWAFEPSLRRLLWEFGSGLEIGYVMCGVPLDDPGRVALEALEAAARSGMPVDARIWLADPPTSSHPVCLAVKAAADQAPPGAYLRRLREAIFCRRRRLEHQQALLEEARAVGDLDLERLRIDLASHATLEAFGADLERARQVPPEHHAGGAGRVKLPSLEFRAPDGGLHGVYGYSDYRAVRDAAVAAGASPSGAPPPSIEQALATYGSMATAEVAAVCGLPGPTAPAALWRLAAEWRVTPEPVLGGELWRLAAGG